MLSYEEALAQLLQQTATLGTETVTLADALGRTLATSVIAELDHPPFPQSAMDGFAISEPITLAPKAITFELLCFLDILAIY